MTEFIILVGFMGAGKTTVGRKLARQLRWRFLDLDDRIVEREGLTVVQLFAEAEARFRQAETAALRDVLAARPAKLVLALGGGALTSAGNRDLIAASPGRTVFLDGAVDTLLARVRRQQVERPLAADENRFRHLHAARLADYMGAHLRVETGSASPKKVAAEIIARLELS